MATLEEVQAAEERMNAAKAALLAYAQRPESQSSDPALYRRLNEELRAAMDEFLRVVDQLRP